MDSKSVNFTSFVQIILTHLKEKLGEEYTVFAHSVKKNNGVELTGVVISRKGCNTSPTFYIDELYHDRITEEETKAEAEKILRHFQQAEFKEDLDLSDFLDYEKVRERIVVKLINAKKNEELLSQVPHKIFYNLALVVYYPVQEAPFEGNAAILVYHTHRQQWKVEEEELLDAAIANTPRLMPGKVESMDAVMRQIFESEFGKSIQKDDLAEMGLDEEDWMEMLFSGKKRDGRSNSMYVLTNRQKLYGAVCMLYPDLLKNFAARMGQDCYILPSSVHEVILVPANETADAKELREIVTDINRTQVAEEEVLADCVYYYSRIKDDIFML